MLDYNAEMLLIFSDNISCTKDVKKSSIHKRIYFDGVKKQ